MSYACIPHGWKAARPHCNEDANKCFHLFAGEWILLPVMCPSIGVAFQVLPLSLQVLVSVASCLTENELHDVVIEHEPEKVQGSFTIHVGDDAWAHSECWRLYIV